MTWTLPDHRDEDERPAWCTGVWQPLPAGYDPVLPLADLSAPTVSIPTLRDMLIPVGGKLPFFRDPAIQGPFVPDSLVIPEGLLAGGTYFQNPHIPVTAHAFAIGFDAIGDEDAPIDGPRIPPLHGELQTDAISVITSPDRLRDVLIETVSGDDD